MNAVARRRTIAGAIVVSTLGLPVLGVLLSRRGLTELLDFPPRLQIPVGYPRYDLRAVLLVLAPLAALGAAWVAHVAKRRHRPAPTTPRQAGRFPAWGWAALGWTGAWWALAWTRLPWFAALQPYTFFPPWLGFIVSVNAVTLAGTGTCQLTHRPIAVLRLFAASGLFWWAFEWLNRFTHNWHYLGVAQFGAVAYAVQATLCFSTVLPAVSAVEELLRGSARLQRALVAGPRLSWLQHRATAFVFIALGAAGLVGAGACPARFFPALWAAPLALLLAADILARRAGPVDAAHGDWRCAGTWALAALVCGGFWELWNYASAAKWIYTVPYVDRWHVFEMPLLGYVGYLPFGLECYYAVDRTTGAEGV